MIDYKNNSGFSLMEMVVVSSIVMIAFIAILVIAEQTIKFRSINQKALVGAQLAQEGLELTRFYRNANWLTQPNILFDVNISYDNANIDSDELIFAVDYEERVDGSKRNDNIFKFYDNDGEVAGIGLSCSGTEEQILDCYLKNDVAKLYIDTADNNFYKINKEYPTAPSVGYEDSGFHRVIKTIYKDSGTADLTDDYLYVISKVHWEDRGKEYNYIATTYLYDYDWYY